NSSVENLIRKKPCPIGTHDDQLFIIKRKKMLFSAFFLGLISSLHCVGMCGPIAMMRPVDRQNEAKKVTQIITYHFGRLTAYATIGLIFGLLG
ncbi:sulfite exporter TauE/SafE family protein, partial [Halomonas sp. SIMBA_159]